MKHLKTLAALGLLLGGVPLAAAASVIELDPAAPATATTPAPFTGAFAPGEAPLESILGLPPPVPPGPLHGPEAASEGEDEAVVQHHPDYIPYYQVTQIRCDTWLYDNYQDGRFRDERALLQKKTILGQQRHIRYRYHFDNTAVVVFDEWGSRKHGFMSAGCIGPVERDNREYLTSRGGSLRDKKVCNANDVIVRDSHGRLIGTLYGSYQYQSGFQPNTFRYQETTAKGWKFGFALGHVNRWGFIMDGRYLCDR